MHLYSLGVDYVYVVRKVWMGNNLWIGLRKPQINTLHINLCIATYQLPRAPAADSCSENSEIRSLDIMHGQGASSLSDCEFFQVPRID